MTEWLEARIKKGRSPHELYYYLGNEHRPESAHHFSNEPWWLGGWVVRLEGADQALVEQCPAVDHVVAFDASRDESLYGDRWPWVKFFFEVSSQLAGRQSDDEIGKLIHCYLNARGWGPMKEARWALRFAFSRATISLRWRLYLRRQYEREGPPVK